jgi:hypothetical protein
VTHCLCYDPDHFVDPACQYHASLRAEAILTVRAAQAEMDSIPVWRLTEFVRRHREALRDWLVENDKGPRDASRPKLTVIQGGAK